MPGSMKRWAFWAGGGLLVLAALAFFLFRPATPRLHFETAPVERGRIAARVTASGTLSALITVQVGSQVSGRISEVLADFNTPVRKGQVLARIDPQPFQASLQQARANSASALANFEKARVQALDADRQYRRMKALAEQGFVATAELDTASASAEAAHAQIAAMEGALEQARAAVDLAQINLRNTTVRSPIDGTVVSRNIDVGQTVAATLQAPTLFLIAQDLRKMQVDTSVAEADVGKLTEGMEATFSVDAYPGEVFRGVVKQIRNAPQTVQNVVTYNAVLSVGNPGLRLRPGMTANVTFVYARRENVLRVSNTALRFRPPPEAGLAGPDARPPGARGEDPARKTVWVVRDGIPSAVPILTGLSDGTYTEVVEGGLQAGDKVVTASSPERQ